MSCSDICFKLRKHPPFFWKETGSFVQLRLLREPARGLTEEMLCSWVGSRVILRNVTLDSRCVRVVRCMSWTFFDFFYFHSLLTPSDAEGQGHLNSFIWISVTSFSALWRALIKYIFLSSFGPLQPKSGLIFPIPRHMWVCRWRRTKPPPSTDYTWLLFALYCKYSLA